MNEDFDPYNEFDNENIFFIIKYLLRSKSLVDAIVNVDESDLKTSIVDRSTLVLTTVLKLEEVMELNDAHWEDDMLYDPSIIQDYLNSVTTALSKNFMSYIQNHEPKVMSYLMENQARPRIKINMTEFEIEFGTPLAKNWNEDENAYFLIKYNELLETFK